MRAARRAVPSLRSLPMAIAYCYYQLLLPIAVVFLLLSGGGWVGGGCNVDMSCHNVVGVWLLRLFAEQVVPKGVTYELIRAVIWLWAYSSQAVAFQVGLTGFSMDPSDIPWIMPFDNSRCFFAPGIPAEMAQRSLIWVQQTWVSGVSLPLLLKLLLLLWLLMLESSESKSPAAHHATEKAKCPVFSHTDATPPFGKCAKSSIF